MSDKMIYKKFYFKNYKGIKETSIELSDGGGIHCIIGKNESGKTTILKGIRDAVNILTTGTIGNNEEYPKGIRDCIDLSVKGLTDDIVFGIEFELEDYTRKEFKLPKNIQLLYFEFIYHFVGGTLRDMTPTEENVYNVKNNKKIKLENQADIIAKIREEYKNKHHIICPLAYYYSDFFTKILDAVFFSSSLCKKSYVETDKIEENNKWKELLNNVLRVSSPDVKTISVNGNEEILSFEGLIENYFAGKIDKRELKKYVIDMHEHLTKKVKETWKKNNVFADDIADIDKVAIEMEIYEKTGEISLSISLQNENEKETPLKDKSLGFRWYFTFLLFTLYRKSKNVLFLLDEPASNLYADIQESLVKCFKSIVAKKDRNTDAYIIYSTHSLYLWDDDIEEATYVIIKYKNDGMKCIKKTDIKEGTREYDSLRVITDHKKCRMPFKILENTLFVEGKEDYCIINLFCKILKNRLQNLFIYYVGGSGNFNQYIKCVIEKKFLVLLDNDNGGDDGYNNLKKEFNYKNIEKDVKMLNSIDANFTDIQSLIETSDKKKLCEIANTKYQDNNRNNIKLSVQKAVYELLSKIPIDKNNEITEQLNQQLSQQTKDNFTKLADAIEKHFKLK